MLGAHEGKRKAATGRVTALLFMIINIKDCLLELKVCGYEVGDYLIIIAEDEVIKT